MPYGQELRKNEEKCYMLSTCILTCLLLLFLVIYFLVFWSSFFLFTPHHSRFLSPPCPYLASAALFFLLYCSSYVCRFLILMLDYLYLSSVPFLVDTCNTHPIPLSSRLVSFIFIILFLLVLVPSTGICWFVPCTIVILFSAAQPSPS
jgi:hypothetical protein